MSLLKQNYLLNFFLVFFLNKLKKNDVIFKNFIQNSIMLFPRNLIVTFRLRLLDLEMTKYQKF